MSLLGQDAEGYEEACAALAGAQRPDFAAIQAKTLLVNDSEDKVSPSQLCEKYVQEMMGMLNLQVLESVGHWHVFEDLKGVANVVQQTLH